MLARWTAQILGILFCYQIAISVNQEKTYNLGGRTRKGFDPAPANFLPTQHDLQAYNNCRLTRGKNRLSPAGRALRRPARETTEAKSQR